MTNYRKKETLLNGLEEWMEVRIGTEQRTLYRHSTKDLRGYYRDWRTHVKDRPWIDTLTGDEYYYDEKTGAITVKFIRSNKSL